ncbi:MAG TPA: glutamate--tRNA ligase [Candidatus Nanoarchaeia archaeon]|nr:glutamate--tRNA ligase [Candidatus Nanoarchaeia archaeon]
MKAIILKHCLKNALDFNGKINPKVVLGLALRDNPDLRKDVPTVLNEIEKTAAEVEKLSLEQIKDKLKQTAPELLKPQKEKAQLGPLKPLPNAKPGKVVLRIAPSPSGPLHIGHAYGASLNHEYAKMYNGKLILRIEDTNPETIYPPAYNMIEEDVRWLTDNQVAEVVLQSSRLGLYYDYAEKLVQQGNAYVCTCDADRWRVLKNEGTACPCRSLEPKEQTIRYAQMFNEYAEGEAVLRAKTDIAAKNPAMRDFGLMRIVEHVHPKTGKEQRVWPLMVFSVAVDDHDQGITHVLNGKDQADNAEKEKFIIKALGWKPPEYRHWGIINFIGFEVSKTKTKLAIEQKEYSGWDDIRLPFLLALKRRGYQPGAFRKYALDIGLSLNDKTVSMLEFWKNIDAFNREIIEPIAKRYFFIDRPREVQIRSLKDRKVQIAFHPDHYEQGYRTLNVSDMAYISEKDFKTLAEGYTHRLMDLCNFEVKGNIYWKTSDRYEDYKTAANKGRIIHWVPKEENIATELILNSGIKVSGLAELNLSAAKEGDIVQLERLAFCRIDKIEKRKVTLWYLHK